MAFRSYKIRLEFAQNVTLPAGLPKQFGALISDPSNLVPGGSTKQRGLSFLNTEGIKMQEAAFKHVPIMNKHPYPITEEDEITDVVYKQLAEGYKLQASDFLVHIMRS